MPAPVDILLPTYEPRPDHLQAALQALLAQTHTEWTALIHDDASTSDVRKIVEPFLADPRIRFLQKSERRGIGGNWNACLAQAGDASFIQFLFQDDHWEQTYLERSVAALARDERIGFTAANHAYFIEGMDDGSLASFYEGVRRHRELSLTDGYQDRWGAVDQWIGHGLSPNIIGEPSFVMLRKSLVDRVGMFREDMPQGLDMEYWLRCLLVSDWCFLKESLGTFRVHAKGASAVHQSRGAGLFDRLQCFELLLHRLPPGALRKKTSSVLRTQIAGMIGKFLQRVQHGGRVSGGGSSALLRFLLRHPLVLFTGVRLVFQSKGNHIGGDPRATGGEGVRQIQPKDQT